MVRGLRVVFSPNPVSARSTLRVPWREPAARYGRPDRRGVRTYLDGPRRARLCAVGPGRARVRRVHAGPEARASEGERRACRGLRI